MIKAVYPYCVKRDRFLMLVEESENNTFTKTVVACTDPTDQDNKRHEYYRNGYLRPHRVLGGRLSSKYREEDRQTLESVGIQILWCGDEWLTLAENRASIPRLRTGPTGSDYRPSELGTKPEPYRRGTLGSPDYIHGSRAKD